MQKVSLKPITSRPPVVIAALTIFAIVGLILVNRLATRFSEQRGALARHLYAQGLAKQSSGHPDDAIEDFRAALIYSRDNFQYQLSLARALRDTGRTAESETYLINLWERAPQDAAVNLALGRLAAREGQVDKTIQYYHNAIYGVWASDADVNRLKTWFELIETLLRLGAKPQAQAELILLSAELPRSADIHVHTADLFVRSGDDAHALDQYEEALRIERTIPQAAAGAGEAAFGLARYGAARDYLELAVKQNPQDQQSAQLLQLTRAVLDGDPLSPRISMTERDRRLRTAFEHAGSRLTECLQNATGDSTTDLTSLKSQWTAVNGSLGKRGAGTVDPMSAMDLVFNIEQQTQKCAGSSDLDQALLLLAQNRNGAER